MKFFEAIGKLAVLLVCFVAAFLVDGIVLKLLWHWYVEEPLGVAAISIPTAIGLGILVNLMTYPTQIYVKLVRMEPDEEDVLTAILTLGIGIYLAALALGLGAFIHLFQ